MTQELQAPLDEGEGRDMRAFVEVGGVGERAIGVSRSERARATAAACRHPLRTQCARGTTRRDATYD